MSSTDKSVCAFDRRKPNSIKRPLAVITHALAGLMIATGGLAFVTHLQAEDHFLTIGGGYSPTGNQVSLERNVYYFRSLLAEIYDEEPQHQILFADGDDPGRDLQYADRSLLPRVNELLARVHRDTSNLHNRYRDHEIPGLFGASSRENLTRWFEKVGSSLAQGDRLFIYATAHGGRSSDRRDPTNTRLYLWNNESINVRELSELLTQIDSDVPIVLMMVQCYSGGFADLIYQGGDADLGLAETNCCGFFATVHDRVAAGCTSDIREEDYQEYSTYFIAALLGETRTGSPIVRPDFDEDGQITFEEAHAYALVESSTIDISIKTSEVLLREYSRLRGEEDETLLTENSPINELLAVATPCERVVVQRLSEFLELSEEDRAEEADELADRLMSEKRSQSRQKRGLDRELGQAADKIKKSVISRWPELANNWNPEAQRVMAEEAEQIVDFIESHASFEDFERVSQQLAELKSRESDFDRKWVKCQRLIRTLENIALSANLPVVADEEVLLHYQHLVDLERQTLGSSSRLE